MGRAPCCSKVGLHRGPWTPREDALLTKYIQAHGEGQWRSLPKRAGLLRCGKSCRLRWMNYLRPDIKRGNITPEEDDLIIRMHSLLGNRWSLIAGRLPGRTDNEIKNYWNTHLSKKLRNQGTDPNTHKKLLIKDPLQELANKKRKSTNSRGKKKLSNNNNNNKQKKSDVERDRDRNTETVVYLPKPIRVAALCLSSSLSIPITDSTTFTLESNNNSGSAASTRSHETLERRSCQQQQEEEENNMVGVVGGINKEGESDEGFGYFGEDHHHHHDLVNGSYDMECQSYYSSDFPADHGTLEKIYEEYFQLLNMEVMQEENQHHMDSFAQSLLV